MASKPPRLKSHAASEFLQSLPLAIWCPRQGPSSRKPSRSRWRLGRVRQRAQGSARVLSCFSLCVTQAALVLMAAGASTDDVDDMLAARRILGPGERLPLSHANACALGARQVCNGSRARPVSQRVRSRVDVQPVFLSFKPVLESQDFSFGRLLSRSGVFCQSILHGRCCSCSFKASFV